MKGQWYPRRNKTQEPGVIRPKKKRPKSLKRTVDTGQKSDFRYFLLFVWNMIKKEDVQLAGGHKPVKQKKGHGNL